jgi:orotate phosphoribosyltransferase
MPSARRTRYCATVDGMNTNQMTSANPKRIGLADHADMVRPTAVPQSRIELVARLATVPGLVRPGVAHWDMKARLPLHPLSNENAYGDLR